MKKVQINPLISAAPDACFWVKVLYSSSRSTDWCFNGQSDQLVIQNEQWWYGWLDGISKNMSAEKYAVGYRFAVGLEIEAEGPVFLFLRPLGTHLYIVCPLVYPSIGPSICRSACPLHLCKSAFFSFSPMVRSNIESNDQQTRFEILLCYTDFSLVCKLICLSIYVTYLLPNC